jgi:hypothetical protein
MRLVQDLSIKKPDRSQALELLSLKSDEDGSNRFEGLAKDNSI